VKGASAKVIAEYSLETLTDIPDQHQALAHLEVLKLKLKSLPEVNAFLLLPEILANGEFFMGGWWNVSGLIHCRG
jgi:hypothetical protein